MSEAALLRWCGAQLRESGVSVENFGSSFASGVALCHLVYRVGNMSDATLAPAAIAKREPVANVRAALVGAKKLGVDDVASADDVLNGDSALVVTLIAALFRAARALNKAANPRVPSVAMATSSTSSTASRASSRVVATPCAKCGATLSGDVVEHQGVKFHFACFGCQQCGKPLGDAVVTLRAKPYCAACAKLQLVELRTKALQQQKSASVEQSSSGGGGGDSGDHAVEDNVDQGPSKKPPPRPKPSPATTSTVTVATPTSDAQSKRDAILGAAKLRMQNAAQSGGSASTPAAPAATGGTLDAAEMAKRRAALALAKAKRSAAAAAATEAPEQVDEPPETTAEAPTPTPSTVIPAEARMSKSAIAASEALAEAKRKREAVAAERARLVADAKRRQEAKKADADRAKLEQQQLQKQQEEEQAAAAAELKARREEMERKRREADEEKKRREAEEKRRKEEEEEKKRREDEERRRVALEAAARKRREEEERKKADEERKKAEEAAAAAREAELTLRRKQAEEKRRREEAERKRVADEEAERKRVADEEAERRRIEEEEAAAAAEEEARQLEALAAEEEALLRAEEEQLERERLEAEAEAAMWEQQLSGAAPVPAADDLVPLDSAPRESDVWASVDAVTASGDTDISSLVMPVVPKASAGRESDIWAVINAETAASAAGVLAAAAPEPVDEDWQRELAELDALSNKDLFDMRQSQIQSLIGADNNNKSEPAAAAAGDSQRQLPLSTPYAQLPSKPAQTQSPPKPTPQPQQEKKPTGQYAHLPGDPRPAPAAAGAGPTRQAPTAGRRPMPTPTRRGAPLAPASAPRAAPTPSIDELVDEDDNAELAAAAIKGVDLAQVRTSTAAERQSEMHDLAALDAILNSAVSNSGAMVALDDGLDDEAILALDVDETDEERELRLEVEQLEREERERQATLKRPPQVRPAATTMIAPTKQAPTRLTPTRSVPQLAVQRGPARTAAAATPAPKPAAVVASPPPAEDEFDFDLDSEMLAEAASHASMSVEPKLAPTSYSSAAAAKPANAAPPPSDEDILNELLGEGVDVDEAVSRLTQVLSAPAPTVKSVSDLVREAEEVEEQQRRSLRAAAAAVAADEPPLSPKPVATTSAARPTVSVVTVPASKRTATVSTPPVTSVQLGTTVNKPLAMKGWLSKQAPSGVLKMWKKRYFVLRDDKLLYFDDANLSNTLGVIGLEGASVCATPQGKTGQFQIIAPGRIFHLQAPSEESMESWLKNLRVGCTYAEHRSLSAAESDVPRAKLREGQLLRIAGNKWKETFLVLNGGVLRVLAGDKHGAVVCTIPLYEATFGDFDPNRPPPNLETSTVGMLKSLLGSVSNFDHTFEVVGAQRSVVLKCYNQKDVSEWLSALETHKKSVERTLNTIQ